MLSASWPHLFQRRVAEARRFLRFGRKGVHFSRYWRVSSRIITALREAVIMEVAEAEWGKEWRMKNEECAMDNLWNDDDDKNIKNTASGGLRSTTYRAIFAWCCLKAGFRNTVKYSTVSFRNSDHQSGKNRRIAHFAGWFRVVGVL